MIKGNSFHDGIIIKINFARLFYYFDLPASLHTDISRILLSGADRGGCSQAIWYSLLFCRHANASAESLRVGGGVSRHFRRHRLYDRRIYTIVGLYTYKLLTYAVYTYDTCVCTAREKKLDVTRAATT